MHLDHTHSPLPARPHPLTFALEPLLEQSEEQYPTVVTEYTSSAVRLYRQDMRADHLIKLLLRVSWRKKKKDFTISTTTWQLPRARR